MPRYYFNIPQGKYAGAPETALDFKDDNEALKEMTAVCSEIIGDVVRSCSIGSNWKIETLDETKKVLFRISLVMESGP
jgi:hypothetical protein